MIEEFKVGHRYRNRGFSDVFMFVRAVDDSLGHEIHLDVTWFYERSGRYISADEVTVKKAKLADWEDCG